MYDSIARNSQLKLIVQEQQEHVVEFKDQGLNELIKIETPYQYLNLVMEEQANEFMNEVVSKEDDYEDQLKWALHEEQQNMHQFGGFQNTKVPYPFQLKDVNYGPQETLVELNTINEGISNT